ncbi:MAG: twin-arginine translocase TatA/TatE family subunit [Pseudobdellovibrio sp.]
MGGVSLPHLLILTLILLIFFGPSRLPALGQSLGKAIKGFKDGLNEADETPNNHPRLTENNDVVKQTTENKS